MNKAEPTHKQKVEYYNICYTHSREARETSRHHQFKQADMANGYASLFYKTLLQFNAGAFVLFPSYITFIAEADFAISSIFIPLLAFIISTVLIFTSILFAYFTTSLGAESERHDFFATDQSYWSNYYEYIGDDKNYNLANKHIKLGNHEAKKFIKKANYFEIAAVIFAILGLLAFIGSLITTTVILI